MTEAILLSKHPLKNIIFDLDNTLCECSKYYHDAYEAFCEFVSNRTGINKDIALGLLKTIDAEGIKIDGFGRHRFPKSFAATSVAIDVLMGKEINKEASEQAWEIGDTVFNAPYEMYPNSYETLKFIKNEGFEMFLCTKGDIDVQRRKILINNLYDIFPENHIYVDVVKNVTHFQKIISDHNLNVNETMAVGDSVKDDVGSANKCGLISVLVEDQQNKGWSYENEKHAPLFTIKSIDLLKDLILNCFTGVQRVGKMNDRFDIYQVLDTPNGL